MEQRPIARFIDFDNGESIVRSLRNIYAREVVHDIGNGKSNELYQLAQTIMAKDHLEYYCSQYHISGLCNYERDAIYTQGIQSLKDSIGEVWYKIALTAQKIGFEHLKMLQELAYQDPLYVLNTTVTQELSAYLIKESAEQIIADQHATPYMRLSQIIRNIVQIGYQHDIPGIEQLESALIRNSSPYIIKYYRRINPETALQTIKIGLLYLSNSMRDPNANQKLITSEHVILGTGRSTITPNKICYIRKI